MADQVPQTIMSTHQISFTVTWLFFFNVSVSSALFRNTKYGFYLHAVFGTLKVLLTIALSLLLLIPFGFNLTFGSQDGNLLFYHALGGLFILSITFSLGAYGYLLRYWQTENQLSSSQLLFRKKIHYIVGWVLGYICKFNIILLWYQILDIYWIMLIWETLFLFVFAYLKFLRPTMQRTILYEKISNIYIPQIKNPAEAELQDYVIFADCVYNIKPLRQLHPAGYQIIQHLKGRQIDRFIYGMYSSQFNPEVKAFSHPANSLDLVGPPVARLITPSAYLGFEDSQLLDVRIKYFDEISAKGQIFLLSLVSRYTKTLQFLGYSNLKQFGQYYSLTIDSSWTRLYTSVNMLCEQNINLMQKAIPGYKAIKNENPTESIDANESISSKNSYQQSLLSKQDSLSVLSKKGKNDLPILMKIYNDGKFTRQLRSMRFSVRKLQLSRPRGQGLQLETLKPGKVIIVAGGTGLFPFMDFIDALFKNQLIQNKHHETQRILINNPVLRENPFKSISIVLLLAVNQPEDIHPLTLQQINILSQNPKVFQNVLRIKQRQYQISSIFKNVEITKQRFEKRLIQEAKVRNLSRIWICGPPRMNVDTGKNLMQNGFQKGQFLYV